jgi:hypothetical protein
MLFIFALSCLALCSSSVANDDLASSSAKSNNTIRMAYDAFRNEPLTPDTDASSAEDCPASTEDCCSAPAATEPANLSSAAQGYPM